MTTKCTGCGKKRHYLRPLPFDQNKQKFCFECYEEVSTEMCIEADEQLMRYSY